MKIVEMAKCIDRIDKKWFRGAYAKYAFARKKNCTFCGRKFHRYYLHGIASPVTEKYSVTCMGIRRGDCPFCGSKDKERWLKWVLCNETDILLSERSIKRKILHFAPEPKISNLILSNSRNDYITGDIVPGRAEYVIDMTNIPYENNTFDYVIASMVLEHIMEEQKALKELIRVIRPDGKILLSVPVAYSLESTYQDNRWEKDEERFIHYGQEDHVRLYGRDIKTRWKELCPDCQIDIQEFKPIDFLTENEIRKYGLCRDYAVFCIRKQVKGDINENN